MNESARLVRSPLAMRRLATGLAASVVCALVMGRGSFGGRVQAQAVASVKQDCVAIGTPDPSVGYTYDHVESTGGRSQYTDYWESVTPTGSRVRVEKPGDTLIQTSIYRVVDDVALLGRMTQAKGNRVIGTTDFRPGLVADPFGRACAGRSWPIPSVTASFSGAQSASAATPAGTLTIIAIREKVTVPAGMFDTVHYVRTSQSRDEYWKSIQHGVVVKHIATVRGGTVTEVLAAITPGRRRSWPAS